MTTPPSGGPPQRLLLDTTVLIDLLRGKKQTVVWWLALDRVPICSEVTRIEVLQGLRRGEEATTARLLASLDWRPVDDAVSRLAGALGREYRPRFPGLSLADLTIAATAMLEGADLITSNTRHFPMIEGLEAPY